DLNVADRVMFSGPLPDGEKLAWLARCRAVVFPPAEEDYGFVTLEAFASRKAAITCRASGRPADLVRDGIRGFVFDSTPESLAAAMTKMLDDSALAERLGGAAFDAGSSLTWPETIKHLVQ